MKKTIAPIVKAAASLANINNQQIADTLHLSSSQAVTNKYVRDSFSGQDLTKIAALCGYKLAFVDKEGNAVLTFPTPPDERP